MAAVAAAGTAGNNAGGPADFEKNILQGVCGGYGYPQNIAESASWKVSAMAYRLPVTGVLGAVELVLNAKPISVQAQFHLQVYEIMSSGNENGMVLMRCTQSTVFSIAQMDVGRTVKVDLSRRLNIQRPCVVGLVTDGALNVRSRSKSVREDTDIYFRRKNKAIPDRGGNAVTFQMYSDNDERGHTHPGFRVLFSTSVSDILRVNTMLGALLPCASGGQWKQKSQVLIGRVCEFESKITAIVAYAKFLSVSSILAGAFTLVALRVDQEDLSSANAERRKAAAAKLTAQASTKSEISLYSRTLSNVKMRRDSSMHDVNEGTATLVGTLVEPATIFPGEVIALCSPEEADSLPLRSFVASSPRGREMLSFISSSTSLPRDNQLIKVKLQKDRGAYYAAGFTCILNHAQGQRSSAEAPPAAPQASPAAMAPPTVIVSAPGTSRACKVEHANNDIL